MLSLERLRSLPDAAAIYSELAASLWPPSERVHLLTDAEGLPEGAQSLLSRDGLPREFRLGSGSIRHLLDRLDGEGNLVLGQWSDRDPVMKDLGAAIVAKPSGVWWVPANGRDAMYCNEGVVEYAALTAIYGALSSETGTAEEMAALLEQAGRCVDASAFDDPRDSLWLQCRDDWQIG